MRSQLKVGTPLDFDTFMTAVIDKNSFNNISDYLREAKTSKEYEILGGGGTDDSVGYYIEPTIVQTSNPKSRLMREEIFGPVLTIYVYDHNNIDEALELCDKSTGFALTGSIFAHDQ